MIGIIILALHKQTYATAAFNLALSIKKHNPDLNITLLSDNIHQKVYRTEHYAVFDWIKEISKDDYTNNGQFCPAKAKLSVYKYSSYKQSLYLDADSICCQNLDSLFEQLKGFAFKSNNVEGYTQWVDTEIFKSFFGVEPGLTINSSWMYFENSKVFKQAEKYYNKGFDFKNLKQRWGKSLPDELFLNASIQKLQVDPKTAIPVMFFDDKKSRKAISEIESEYYLMTFYGNANSTSLSYREWYDKHLFKLCKEKGIEHRFKMSEIIAHKHVNSK
ncbi:MAG: hypothetical protein V4608_11010 [Bacteroidota bacterium]